MVLRLRATTELSSLIASSTMSRLGLFLRSKIAVLKSFLSTPFWLQRVHKHFKHNSLLLATVCQLRGNAYSSCAVPVDGPASAILVSDQQQRSLKPSPTSVLRLRIYLNELSATDENCAVRKSTASSSLHDCSRHDEEFLWEPSRRPPSSSSCNSIHNYLISS